MRFKNDNDSCSFTPKSYDGEPRMGWTAAAMINLLELKLLVVFESPLQSLQQLHLLEENRPEGVYIPCLRCPGSSRLRGLKHPLRDLLHVCAPANASLHNCSSDSFLQTPSPVAARAVSIATTYAHVDMNHRAFLWLAAILLVVTGIGTLVAQVRVDQPLGLRWFSELFDGVLHWDKDFEATCARRPRESSPES